MYSTLHAPTARCKASLLGTSKDKCILRMVRVVCLCGSQSEASVELGGIRAPGALSVCRTPPVLGASEAAAQTVADPGHGC
jgi:hypothetical protein